MHIIQRPCLVAVFGAVLAVVVVVVRSQFAVADGSNDVGERMYQLAGQGREELKVRSMLLNNLRRQYQFQLGEIEREMRERVVRLAIDGMGVSGRVSAVEEELAELSRRQVDLQLSLTSSTQARDRIEQHRKEQRPVSPEVQARIENDARVGRYQDLLDDADFDLAAVDPDSPDAAKLIRRRDLIQQKLDQRRSHLTQSYASMEMRRLDDEIASMQSMLEVLSKRLDQRKKDYGDLILAEAHYVTLRDECNVLRTLLQQVDQEIAIISQGAFPLAGKAEGAAPATTQPADERHSE